MLCWLILWFKSPKIEDDRLRALPDIARVLSININWFTQTSRKHHNSFTRVSGSETCHYIVLYISEELWSDLWGYVGICEVMRATSAGPGADSLFIHRRTREDIPGCGAVTRCRHVQQHPSHQPRPAAGERESDQQRSAPCRAEEGGDWAGVLPVRGLLLHLAPPHGAAAPRRGQLLRQIGD